MARSMTAFARVEQGDVVWEMRSVNHRYLDVTFSMPDSLRHLESDLKGYLKGRVFRGKLESSLKINNTALAPQVSVNEELVTQLKEALDRITHLTNIGAESNAIDLMRWPNVLTTSHDTENLTEDIRSGFTAATEQLVAMRAREGDELAGLMETRLDDMAGIVQDLRETAPTIAQSRHDKLVKRLEELNIKADPARLEQELVILAQKLDVMEELDRLSTHMAETRRSLNLEQPVGRRLDFLMQELNREANTLSSKSTTGQTTLHTVDLKVAIEQVREQVQNIE